MAGDAKFQYFETPISLSVEDIEGAHLEAFVVTGIVNPYGPTLSFLATAGRSAKRPLVYAMLNPFSCEVKQIGTFTDGDSWFPDEVFANLVQFLSGSCPTLILTSSDLDTGTRSRVTESIIAHFEDAETVLENVREFFGDPMGRVSQAIGIPVSHPGDAPAEIQHAEWSDILSDARHVRPEIRALLFAWDGSINKSGIQVGMRDHAFKTERMKAILYPLLESVWMPEPVKEEPIAHQEAPERPLREPKDLDEIRRILQDRNSWDGLRGDNLLQFMEWCLLLYGREIDNNLVPHLNALYNHVRTHTDPEHRQQQLQRISLAAEKHGLAACTLLPPLLCDDDPWVVSTAMLDYIAMCHTDPTGLPFEFSELDELFRRGTFDNPGGALGGLITSGDRRFHPKIHEWKQSLNQADIRTATNCRTPFITHGEVLFWLDWADELVDRHDNASEGILGLVASAVGLLGKQNPHDVVQDVERRYPAHSVEHTVVVLQSWQRSEYAQEIAERLYRLEDGESVPKVFSAVLRAWGLEPRADLIDQFIPEE